MTPSPLPKRRLLVADDDGHIREVIRYALSSAGYAVEEAADGRQAWESFRRGEANSTAFDLVVLDILMPGLDGLDVCRRIRQQSRTPIIFLSSKDEELDRILGLELGADDYITKPFSPRELVARVKATLRRYDDVEALLSSQSDERRPDPEKGHAADEAELLRHGRLVMDLFRHECRVDSDSDSDSDGDATTLVLTVSEFGLLRALLESPQRALSRAQLVELAYGSQHFLSDRTVDSHIRRIRKKLKSHGLDPIETVYGVGYRLAEATEI